MTYRYELHRSWLTGYGRALWIMLNPSTADDYVDDPTIRRCIAFSGRWGLSGLDVVNLYALRSTNPRALLESPIDSVGPQNDTSVRAHLAAAATAGWPVVAAWGQHARRDRVEAVTAMAAVAGVLLQCLGTTLTGQPRHPLYVPGSTRLRPWCPHEAEQASDLHPGRPAAPASIAGEINRGNLLAADTDTVAVKRARSRELDGRTRRESREAAS